MQASQHLLRLIITPKKISGEPGKEATRQQVFFTWGCALAINPFQSITHDYMRHELP